MLAGGESWDTLLVRRAWIHREHVPECPCCSRLIMLMKAIGMGKSISHLPSALFPLRRRWIPGSAKFVTLGSYARNTGCLQVEQGSAAQGGGRSTTAGHWEGRSMNA